MTSRTRRLIWWTGSILVALVVVVAVVMAAAPRVVRWAATSWAESLTGREVTVGDVHVVLREGRAVLHDVAIADPRRDGALATIDRLVVDLRWWPLLRGRIRVEELALEAPVVRVLREPDGSISVDDVVARLLERPPAGEPRDIEIARTIVHDGRVILTDRAVAPERVWAAVDLDAKLTDLATRGEARGAGVLTARLADGTLRVEAEQLRLAPAHARAEARATALNLDGIGAYVPADAALQPVAGRLSSRARLLFDEQGLRLDGRTTLDELDLRRPGQSESFVTAPRITLAADGVRLAHGGTMSAERLEVDGAARIYDSRAARPGPTVLPRIHAVVHDVSVPSETPARVSVDVALPDDGGLQARGSATFEPLSMELAITLKDAPAAPLVAYIPASSAVQVRGGRLDSRLDLRYIADQGLHLAGSVQASGVALYRRHATEPFLIHPVLDVGIDDLQLQEDGLMVERLTFSARPTVIDRSVMPAQRYEVVRATGTVEDFTWPSQGPARVQAAARLAGGARSTLEGTITVQPLDVSARVRFDGVDARRLNAYLPPAAPFRVEQGAAGADIRVRHAGGGPTRLSAAATVHDLAVVDAEGDEVVKDPRLRLTAELALQDATVRVERATASGTPTLAGVELRGLEAVTRDLSWPSGAAAPVQATAKLPEQGTLDASGSVRPDDGEANLDVAVREAALGPWAPLLGIRAPAAGRVDATLAISGNLRRPGTLTVTGDTVAHEVRIGDAEEPAIRVRRAQASGLRVEGTERIHLDGIVLEAPAVVVTRAREGGFPILAMLGVRGAEREDGREAAASAAITEADATRRPPAIDVDRIVINRGYARFVDRTTIPPFTEELRQVAATVSDLDTADAEAARVELDAVVGDGGALHLAGEVAPFARPFVLDVAGTLSDFRVPTTNPYLQQLLGWVARHGQLTTQVRYRVEGDRLEATNEVLIQKLAVRRATEDVDPRVGVPLGLIVGLLKNARGDIEVTVPVSGNLGRPEFGFGDALARAFRQLVGKVITGPFRAIGRIVRGDDPDEIEDLRVEPVRFPEGSASLTPEAREHVEQVGAFLADRPQMGIALRPVVTRDDLPALRRDTAVARVQRYQREQQLADFDAAARALAGAAADAPIETVLQALSEQEAMPVDAAQQLAAARAAATREALAAVAGDKGTRIRTAASAIATDDAEGGRVEIQLTPATATEGAG